MEMLDCDSRELVYVCAGVLVNMMSDASRRSIFQQENGVLRFVYECFLFLRVYVSIYLMCI